MTEFMERYNLPKVTQSGYHKGHSTNTVAIKLRDDILRAMNKVEATLAVIADSSKAFDIVD